MNGLENVIFLFFSNLKPNRTNNVLRVMSQNIKRIILRGQKGGDGHIIFNEPVAQI